MDSPPVVHKDAKKQKKPTGRKGGSCDKLFTQFQDHQQPLMREHESDGENVPAFYHLDTSLTTLKSRPTFGTNECLHSKEQKLIGEDTVGLVRSASFISRPLSFPVRSEDAESICRPAPAFGRSRRMSRSLPELRDIQFVSVLPDLEEEESDLSEDEVGEEIIHENPARIPWHRKLDFLLCSVCQALGLSNFWRFPYYCYGNGGGSFMLAYLILLLVCGVPLLCMELAIGQLTQSGPISALGQLCPLMKGIGVASVMLSFWLTAYYSVLVGWNLFYVFNSFYSPPRWTRCNNMWNSKICQDHLSVGTLLPFLEQSLSTLSMNVSVENSDNNSSVPENISSAAMIDNAMFNTTASGEEIHGNSSYFNSLIEAPSNFSHPAVEFINVKMLEVSNGIEESGELRFEILAAVLFVWVLIFFALRKTDFLRGTTIYVLTAASHLLLFSIFLRTVALQGAKNGLHYLFTPNWTEMANPKLWLYALVQAFHSLGVVLGPSILMGSCHKQHNNLLRDAIVLALVTVLTVVVIGCVTFGTLGHIAFKLNKPIAKVLHNDPSTVFVIYSVVIGSMPLPSCWGVLFFLVFLCLGLDSQVKLMATLVAALKEAYTYYIKQRFQGHSLFLAVICGFCFAGTIPYLTQAGIFFFQLMDHYIAVLAVSVVALLELCTLSWLYGAGNLSSCIQQMTGKSPSYFYKVSWVFSSPLIILGILLYSALKMSRDVIRDDYLYPTWAHIVGWFMFALSLIWVPILAVAAYRKAPKAHIFSRISTTIQPKIRAHSDSIWDPKPVIIMNGSTVTDAEFPDYKLPEIQSSFNSMQSSIVDRPSIFGRNIDQTVF